MEITQINRQFVLERLPKREEDSNKGDFGKVLAVAGSLSYRGAAALCTESALRTGAGLVYIASVDPVIDIVISRTPEACVCGCRATREGYIHPKDAADLRKWFAGKRPTLLMGCGLGEGAAPLLTGLLPADADWSGVVLDADALNALTGGQVHCVVPDETIFTPHPGEMARLLGKTVAEVQADRPAAALACAERYGCIAVLKGSHTLIATPQGQIFENTTGNPGLARGGSGDVLAGMIAALLAQGLTPADAACCGVWLHGEAADRCVRRLGQLTMLPHDILTDLGALMVDAGR